MTQHVANPGTASPPPILRPTARWRPVVTALVLLLGLPGPGLAQPVPATPVPLALVPPAGAPAPPPVGRVLVEDRTFESKALGRSMTYRVLLPAGYPFSTQRYPVLYLLHGLNGTFSDWERRTQLTELLQAYRLIVVMPEGQNSWYGDSVERAADRFESYVLDDVVGDVEKQYRAIGTRHARAVAGLSMGGYGAMKFALKRPAQFLVAGSFSGAFSLVRAGAPASPATPPSDETPLARTVRETVTAVYGPPGSEARAANDLFALAQRADVSRLPYLYVDCGTEDSLLRINREFAAVLHERKAAFEYHELPGAHTWDYWDRQIGEFLRVLARRMPIDGPPRRP